MCERCGKRESEVHLVRIVNGERRIEHLCRKCAGALLPPGDMNSMMKMTLSLESITGMQEMFKDLLGPLFNEKEDTAGAASDSEVEAVVPALSDRIKLLKKEIAKATESENYERAAELRDTLMELEKSVREGGN